MRSMVPMPTAEFSTAFIMNVNADEERELGAGAREADQLLAQLVLPLPQVTLDDNSVVIGVCVSDSSFEQLARRSSYS